jgi:hypothetical protein
VHPVPADVAQYLSALPDERRELLTRVRELVVDNLPAGYVEMVTFGMPSYVIPLERYPRTYNGKPLQYLAMASQKSYCALYLMGVYGTEGGEAEFRKRWAAGGRRLDLGRSCLRFRSWDDLDAELLAETVAAVSPEDYIASYDRVRSSARSPRNG